MNLRYFARYLHYFVDIRSLHIRLLAWVSSRCSAFPTIKTCVSKVNALAIALDLELVSVKPIPTTCRENSFQLFVSTMSFLLSLHTVGKSWNTDRAIHWELCLQAQPPLCHDSTIQRPPRCTRHTVHATPQRLLMLLPILPAIVNKFFNWGQQLAPYLERTIPGFQQRTIKHQRSPHRDRMPPNRSQITVCYSFRDVLKCVQI